MNKEDQIKLLQEAFELVGRAGQLARQAEQEGLAETLGLAQDAVEELLVELTD